VGDGSHDDTAAWNTTVAAAIAGGLPIHLPKGVLPGHDGTHDRLCGDCGERAADHQRRAIIDAGRSHRARSSRSPATAAPPAAPQFARIWRQGHADVQGDAPAYVVQVGKTDFSDIHQAARLEHLVATTPAPAPRQAGCSSNYLVNGDLFVAGTTTGGAGGVALEQVQGSRLTGSGLAGSPGTGLLLENGANTGNVATAFAFPGSNYGLGITSAASQGKHLHHPELCSTTAINATAGSGNLLVNPLYGAGV